MSLAGGDMGDMADRLSDAEIESLIAGSTEANPEFGELIADLKEYAQWKPDPTQQADHLVQAVAAMGITAGAVLDDADSLSAPLTKRRQRMIGRIMSTRLAKVLTGALAALLATSGVAWAATGNSPVDQVSTIAQQVEHVFGSDVDEPEVAEHEMEDIKADDVDDIDSEESLVEDSELEDTETEEVKDDDESEEIDDHETEEVKDDDESEEIDDHETELVKDDDESEEIDDHETEEVKDDDESEEIDDQKSDHYESEYEEEGEHESDGGHDD